MQVAVALDQRYLRTPDGSVWTQATHAYAHFQRYLEVFDGVKIIARVQDVDRVPHDWIRADGPRVQAFPVPHYLGPAQFALRCRSVRRAVEAAAAPDDAVILRLPSTIGQMLGKWLVRQRRPLAVEMIADPYELFAPGALRHPLQPVVRRVSTSATRALCRAAVACGYVTQAALQRRYPAGAGAFSAAFSDVILADEDFRGAPRDGGDFRRAATLVHVASLATRCKGTDVLIEAVARCRAAGLPLRLRIAGEGRHRGELEALARRRGVAAAVCFLGQLTCGRAVLDELDRADLFVLPSRAEGLPRALIEAFARGLPAVASRVGGIPEILAEEWLVAPDDADDLAQKITRAVQHPRLLAQMSAENLRRAQAFRGSVIAGRRREFYEYIRRATARRRAAA